MAVTGEGLELAIARLAASRAAAEQAGQQAALMARLTQALADLRGHERTRAEHDRLAVALDAARRAEPVRPLLTALADADAAVGQARGELLSLIPEPSGDMLAGHGGAGAGERAEAAERDAAGLQHLADMEDGSPAQEAELAAQEEAAKKASDRVAALEEARGGLPARIAQLEGERDQATAAAGGLDTARARLEEITVRRDAACAAAELAPQVEAAHSAMQAAVDAHQVLVDAHQAGVNALLGGMAAELAAQLTAGEPCPVCGSPEHPAPAHPQPDAVSAADVAGLGGAARRGGAWARAPGRGVVAGRPGTGGPDRGGRWPGDGGAGRGGGDAGPAPSPSASGRRPMPGAWRTNWREHGPNWTPAPPICGTPRLGRPRPASGPP